MRSLWRCAGPRQDLTFSETVVLSDFLERFAKRSWSSTWRLGDRELADLVKGLRAAVIELYGSADQTIETEVGFWARTYRAPDRK